MPALAALVHRSKQGDTKVGSLVDGEEGRDVRKAFTYATTALQLTLDFCWVIWIFVEIWPQNPQAENEIRIPTEIIRMAIFTTQASTCVLIILSMFTEDLGLMGRCLVGQLIVQVAHFLLIIILTYCRLQLNQPSVDLFLEVAIAVMNFIFFCSFVLFYKSHPMYSSVHYV